MKLDLVIVEWHDAHAYRERWFDVDTIDPQPLVVYSVGWLLPNAKKDHVVITQSHNSEDDLDGALAVPCGMVQSLRVVSSTDGVPFSTVRG